MTKIRTPAERKHHVDDRKCGKWKFKCCDRNRASPEEDTSEPRENPERMEILKSNRRIGEKMGW